ncbi:hypothetical protein [Rariglobus hedericola]|uniref:NfeD-like C-terminal domain-containing protein n=1 Tax=Rariglobus hedericola TaxID=2597822 RepID=A0A556QDJ2_9BACT|nr:hypothetical protein [Rariglobus hedericola]TSJ74729.1 hypothetical protein FPL22_17455 [Rariglobus hedericola]
MTTLALLTQVSQWWDELNLARQVFYGFGIIAGVVAVILAVLSMIGFDHHDSIDAIGDADTGDGGGIFSIKPLTGFFLGFGWAGGLALDNGLGLFAATVIAIVSGGILMGIIVAMFRAIQSMRSDGTVRIDDALNATGTVYITLPPSKGSGGQVVVSFHGRQETFAALNVTDRAIPSGERVKVIQIVDPRTVLVEPL